VNDCYSRVCTPSGIHHIDCVSLLEFVAAVFRQRPLFVVEERVVYGARLFQDLGADSLTSADQESGGKSLCYETGRVRLAVKPIEPTASRLHCTEHESIKRFQFIGERGWDEQEMTRVAIEDQPGQLADELQSQPILRSRQLSPLCLRVVDASSVHGVGKTGSAP
jgi:hypothetical protein